MANTTPKGITGRDESVSDADRQALASSRAKVNANKSDKALEGASSEPDFDIREAAKRAVEREVE